MSDKPKCPVFGCTIPRGIPHEHPAGVSAVMRDPSAPLNADERAELESFRRERDFMTRQGLKAFSKHSMYVVPEAAPIHAGRKLLMARQMGKEIEFEHKEWCRLRRLDPVTLEALEVLDARELLANSMLPTPGRTLAQSIGRIAAWCTGIPALLLAAFAIGTYCGWWV